MEEKGTYKVYSLPHTAAEYFAGIGLVRLGLERTGWNIVFANDNDPKKKEMYRGYFPDADLHYNEKNVFDLTLEDVPATTLATSSFPCIDLSLAGNRNGVIQGKHSSAFWGFIKILEEQKKAGIEPPIILLENVSGWLSSNKGEDFRITVQALNSLEYACDVFMLNAQRFTPQSRPRVFLVGTQFPIGETGAEGIYRRTEALSPDSLIRAVRANQDLVWNSLDLPAPPPKRKNGLAEEVIEKLAPDDPRWWPEAKVRNHLEMMENSHLARVKELQSGYFISYRTFFRRRRNGKQRAEVRADDIAGCLRTAVGGSSRQFIIAAGQGKIRMRGMTPREYARLQGAPDDYPILVDENQALTGFGDAVCVPAIEWIGKNVLVQLTEHLKKNRFLAGTIEQRLNIGEVKTERRWIRG